MISIDELKQRYSDLGLKTEIEDLSSESEPTLFERPDRKLLKVFIPMAREEKAISILDRDNLILVVANSQIEYCRFIKGYEAIWSEKMNFIECALDAGLRMPSRMIIRRIAKSLGMSGFVESDELVRFEIPSPRENIRISIGQASVEQSLLCSMPGRYGIDSSPRSITLRIEGLNITTHDRALNMLCKIGHSILFQLDLITNLPLYLVMERQNDGAIFKRPASKSEVELTSPNFEYDPEPMALYWYGRRANGMPLLRFLAYYQALEFYFPVYSEREAQNQIRNAIKDPRFNVNRDADIANILSLIKLSGSGRALGDENTQLHAELHTCLTANELTQFITNEPSRAEFFKSKTAKQLSQKIISVTSSEDLRDQVADRIYDIRCRVVHTKASFESQSLLLPFSPEERNLHHDLELLEFVTRKVIIAGSRPLQLD